MVADILSLAQREASEEDGSLWKKGAVGLFFSDVRFRFGSYFNYLQYSFSKGTV